MSLWPFPRITVGSSTRIRRGKRGSGAPACGTASPAGSAGRGPEYGQIDLSGGHESLRPGSPENRRSRRSWPHRRKSGTQARSELPGAAPRTEQRGRRGSEAAGRTEDAREVRLFRQIGGGRKRQTDSGRAAAIVAGRRRGRKLTAAGRATAVAAHFRGERGRARRGRECRRGVTVHVSEHAYGAAGVAAGTAVRRLGGSLFPRPLHRHANARQGSRRSDQHGQQPDREGELCRRPDNFRHLPYDARHPAHVAPRRMNFRPHSDARQTGAWLDWPVTAVTGRTGRARRKPPFPPIPDYGCGGAEIPIARWRPPSAYHSVPSVPQVKAVRKLVCGLTAQSSAPAKAATLTIESRSR